MGFKNWVNYFRKDKPGNSLEEVIVYPEVLESDPRAPKAITKAPKQTVKKAPQKTTQKTAKKVSSTTVKTKTTARKPVAKKPATKKPVAKTAKK